MLNSLRPSEYLPYLPGGLSLHFVDHVGIPIHGHPDGAVAQRLHDHSGLDSLGDQETSAGMSKGMKGLSTDARGFQNSVESPPYDPVM